MFLDAARDPAKITPGGLVVAMLRTPLQSGRLWFQCCDLNSTGDGTVAHRRLLSAPSTTTEC